MLSIGLEGPEFPVEKEHKLLSGVSGLDRIHRIIVDKPFLLQPPKESVQHPIVVVNCRLTCWSSSRGGTAIPSYRFTCYVPQEVSNVVGSNLLGFIGESTFLAVP